VPLTDQTGQARDEVSQVRLGGFVSTLLGSQGYFSFRSTNEHFDFGQLANVASLSIVRHTYTQDQIKTL
jgi:hypothetical protein